MINLWTYEENLNGHSDDRRVSVEADGYSMTDNENFF